MELLAGLEPATCCYLKKMRKDCPSSGDAFFGDPVCFIFGLTGSIYRK